jgi:hypothetical protein
MDRHGRELRPVNQGRHEVRPRLASAGSTGYVDEIVTISLSVAAVEPPTG